MIIYSFQLFWIVNLLNKSTGKGKYLLFFGGLVSLGFNPSFCVDGNWPGLQLDYHCLADFVCVYFWFSLCHLLFYFCFYFANSFEWYVQGYLAQIWEIKSYTFSCYYSFGIIWPYAPNNTNSLFAWLHCGLYTWSVSILLAY
jgi:hypothetical protein